MAMVPMCWGGVAGYGTLLDSGLYSSHIKCLNN